MDSNIKPLFTWRSAICDSDLTATTRHVLLTLSLYMNEMGESGFPSLGRLATNTGLHRSTVIRAIDNAISQGWLEKQVRKSQCGNFTSNLYLPKTPVVAECDHPSCTERPPQSHSATKVVAECDPNTSINSPTNSPTNSPLREGDKSPRATRLPDDFELSFERLNWALMESKQTNEWVQRQFDLFTDYWKAKAGKEARKANWNATWRNWIRRATDYEQQKVSNYAANQRHCTSGIGSSSAEQTQHACAEWLSSNSNH